jgi:X-X-X-Leu-X-X-Gly heptad repeat protein
VGTVEAEVDASVLGLVGARVVMSPGSDVDIDGGAPLSEVLGKPTDTLAELRDVLRPVGVARDVLSASGIPGDDGVSELRDSVSKLVDGIAEL